MVALSGSLVVYPLNAWTGVLVVGESRLIVGDPFCEPVEPDKLGAGMEDGGATVLRDDGEGVIRAEVDGRFLGRVLRCWECVSEVILALPCALGGTEADRMMDANRVGSLVVDEFEARVGALPLGIAVKFERDALVPGKSVLLFECFSNTELDGTAVSVPGK